MSFAVKRVKKAQMQIEAPGQKVLGGLECVTIL